MVLEIGGKRIGLSMPHVMMIALRDHARAHYNKMPYFSPVKYIFTKTITCTNEVEYL